MKSLSLNSIISVCIVIKPDINIENRGHRFKIQVRSEKLGLDKSTWLCAQLFWHSNYSEPFWEIDSIRCPILGYIRLHSSTRIVNIPSSIYICLKIPRTMTKKSAFLCGSGNVMFTSEMSWSLMTMSSVVLPYSLNSSVADRILAWKTIRTWLNWFVFWLCSFHENELLF